MTAVVPDEMPITDASGTRAVVPLTQLRVPWFTSRTRSHDR
jgi:hypothetical protein